MAIKTGWLQTTQIAAWGALNCFTPDDGFARTGGNTTRRAQTKQRFPIRAGSSTLRFLFVGMTPPWTVDANQSDMLTSLSVQRWVSGAASGSFTTAFTNVTVPKGYTYLSDPLNLTVTAGEELMVNCWGAASESGRYISGTMQQRPPDLGSIGDSLTFDSTGATLLTDYDDDIAWCPGAILGESRAQSLSLISHSLGVAIHNEGDSGPSLAADALGVAHCGFGQGGALLTQFDSTTAFDMFLLMGRQAIIFGMINALNNFAANANMDGYTGSAIATATGTGQTTSLADQFRYIARRLSALGCNVYCITENYPGQGATARHLEVWHAWNEYATDGSLATYCGSILTGVIDSRPYFAAQPYQDGVPLSPTDSGGRDSTDIHANYAEFGEAVEAYFGPGGAGESALVADTNNLVESYFELFHGPAGTPGAAGALPTGWVEWYYTTDAARLAINGTGAIKVVSPNTRITHAIQTTALVGTDAAKTFVVRCYSAPWVTQSDNQGLHIGLYDSASTTVDSDTRSGFNHAGYSFRFYNESGQLKLYSQRFNSETNGGGNSNAQVATIGSGQALASGDILTVEITRTLSGGNNSFVVLVYRNGVLLNGSGTTVSDSTTPAAYQGALYLSIGTAGNTATTHTNNAATWDAVRTAVYDATVIDDLTGPATLYVVKGGSSPVDIAVTQSAPTAGPAVGVVVTTSISGLSGATIGSAATTDGTGSARLAEGNAFAIPDTLAVGTTGTLTVTCGGVSVDIPVEVIEEAGAGGGVTGVVVSPGAATVTRSGTVQLGAVVDGVLDDGTLTTWSVQSGGGSVTDGGLLTAPATDATVVVRAALTATPATYDEATITVSGVAGAETMIHQGPFVLRSVSTADPLTIVAWVGEQKSYLFDLLNGSGDPVSLDGMDVYLTATNEAGTAVFDDVAIDIDSAVRGAVSWAMGSAWATAGAYRVTILADGGAGNTHRFGPITVNVRAL